MEKLIIIFSFTKTFYEAYHQKLPLDNYPELLQELLNLDIISFIKNNEDKAIEKAIFWQEEAYRNFDRIGKIGIPPSNELNLDIEPSKLWDCSFMRVLRMFNERNFYIASCLSNKKSFESNENLIKSQIKLEPFKNVSLELFFDEPKSELRRHMEQINENSKTQPCIIIQEKYLERFIKSLDIFILKDSKKNLPKLLNGENVSEGIKFSCPANSVITFFKEMHKKEVIVSSKAISKQFIHNYFLFENKKNKNEFKHPSLNNITNYLTRETAPGVITEIIFQE
ncbi:hypothetical protein [uncultured Chryseobacterium sp.]|uniref:hypothetical protein n=1 Tax=uncultured Chryseobacterium sp. TaxID=259322 RepID=UPI0025D522A2|nr:hypothetical protein [uncultured Chryseobacterium sp.]